MSPRVALILASALTLIPAAAAAAPGAAEPVERGDDPEVELEPRGTYRVTPPELFAEGGPTIAKLIFVNRCEGGCTIFPGSNNSRANTSSIADETSTLTQFSHSQQVWDDTIACIREVYAPYDVEVVTDDPGDLFHHEAILAGTPQELGLSGAVGGIAPLASDCSPQNNVISFSFSNSSPANWVDLCWTVAQESAHAFGLDHAFDCSDPMTYLPNCGQKFFRDKNLPCGEFEQRPCQCTGNTQNSHKKLHGIFGEGTLPTPPTVSVLLPADGATVTSAFPVYAEATHERGIGWIEFYFNGWLWGTVEGHNYQSRDEPYPYTTPASLPDGVIDIEARAYNDLGVPASAFLTVTKGAPCTSADQCAGGQFCEEGKCIWPEPTGVLGDACERNEECVSLLCTEGSSGQFCTESCFVGINNTCPEDFECIAAGEQGGVCWLADGGGGGCCSVGGNQRPPIVELLLASVLLGFVIRRRRA